MQEQSNKGYSLHIYIFFVQLTFILKLSDLETSIKCTSAPTSLHYQQYQTCRNHIDSLNIDFVWHPKEKTKEKSLSTQWKQQKNNYLIPISLIILSMKPMRCWIQTRNYFPTIPSKKDTLSSLNFLSSSLLKSIMPMCKNFPFIAQKSNFSYPTKNSQAI